MTCTLRVHKHLRQFEFESLLISEIILYDPSSGRCIDIPAPLESLHGGIGIHQKRDVRALTLNSAPTRETNRSVRERRRNGGHFIVPQPRDGHFLRFAHLYLDMTAGDVRVDGEFKGSSTTERWDELHITALFNDEPDPITIGVYLPSTRELVDPREQSDHDDTPEGMLTRFLDANASAGGLGAARALLANTTLITRLAATLPGDVRAKLARP